MGKFFGERGRDAENLKEVLVLLIPRLLLFESSRNVNVYKIMNIMFYLKRSFNMFILICLCCSL